MDPHSRAQKKKEKKETRIIIFLSHTDQVAHVWTAALTIYASLELFQDTLNITKEVFSDAVLWEHLIAKHMTYGLKQS